MRRALAAVILAALAAPAAASVVLPLTPADLEAGAERVATATVTALAPRWSADGTRVETVVTLAADDGAALTIVQPGGDLGRVRQEILGMPRYRVGERARFYLRHNPGGVTWRVYGWSQGKWDQRTIAGVPVFLPGPRPDDAAFAHNGMIWPAARMPVPYLINSAGSDDLTMPEVTTAIHAAFQTWQDVPCSTLTFQDAGPTTLGVAIDGQNAILFIESGWIYGAEAAGATALTILDGQQTADVAMNGEQFHWAIGPSGALAASGTFDLQAVLTHELGHFSGLGHTQRAHDTMYYSWTPWAGQRVPSADDKLGLCTIYPTAGDECAAAGSGCPTGQTCTTTAAGRLCDGAIDPIGAPCNYDYVECGDFCLFTVADLSDGYCSRFCDSNADCPLSHHCAPASAGSMPVNVCFAGAQPPPPTDASTGCPGDDACPAGQYCSTMAACTFDCRTTDDCPRDELCDPRGRCVAGPGGGDGGGCGCGAGSGPAGAGALALIVAAVASRRRRRR
ncbi:MAG: matrixin family metalloprotease [Myxococcales bacterium]|nr:matrixin family metalloprotease [Myxococcales bacterium]